jgi:hypothetical protein
MKSYTKVYLELQDRNTVETGKCMYSRERERERERECKA